jgi:hypothetical protein
MHPVFAAKAADPEGDYVRRWCPELARLPVPFVHAPWEAPATVLAAAGVTLGRHYPRRIVTDLEAARRGSLEAVVAMRRGAAGRRYVLPDGHDALPLPDGRFARAITRVDYRQMAQQVGASDGRSQPALPPLPPVRSKQLHPPPSPLLPCRR